MQAYCVKCKAKKEMKECQKHHDEERQASDPGRLSELWHESVQDRQGLGLLRHSRPELRGAGYPRYQNIQPLFIIAKSNETAIPRSYHDPAPKSRFHELSTSAVRSRRSIPDIHRHGLSHWSRSSSDFTSPARATISLLKL